MNLRTRVLVIGGVIGALLGVGASYLYLRSASIRVDEEGNEHLPPVNPGKALTVSLGLLGVVKQVVGMSS